MMREIDEDVLDMHEKAHAIAAEAIRTLLRFPDTNYSKWEIHTKNLTDEELTGSIVNAFGNVSANIKVLMIQLKEANARGLNKEP